MQPTPLWERFLPAGGIGRHLLCHAEVGSTMDAAWALLDAGPPHGTAVMALVQRQGRGRFGRAWLSGPGESLLLSVVLRPSPKTAQVLSMLTSLAVVRAVREMASLECTIKWPNDVQHEGKKLCGTLVEVRVNTDGIVSAVVGIGLNLSLDSAVYPEISNVATSILAATGDVVDPATAADAVLRALEVAYEQAIAGVDVVSDWRTHLNTLGRRVTLRQGEDELTGTAEDVAPDGSLLLRTDDGSLHTLDAGEVTSQA